MKSLLMLASGAVTLAAFGNRPTIETVAWTPTVTAAVYLEDFDHAKHAFLGACTTCHANVAAGQVYPEPTFCAQCHDGSMQPEVSWRPAAVGSQWNLRFRHENHVAVDQCDLCHVRDGGVVRAAVTQCMSCHGLTNHPRGEASACTLCHVQPPAPQSHEGPWRMGHASEAAATPETCATCHVRSDCLDCHRPGAASPSGGFHPADFLANHPGAAYSQEFGCASCHNPGQFCQSCHLAAGLVTGGPASGVFHDGTGAFTVGHGQAARQSLGSCVACHAERDCVKCHVVLNPHGPTFNAEEQARAARSACTVCHGNNVPVP